MAPTRPCEPSVFEGANKSTLVDICRLGIITPPRAARLDILEFTHTHTHIHTHIHKRHSRRRQTFRHAHGRKGHDQRRGGTVREEEEARSKRMRHGRRGEVVVRAAAREAAARAEAVRVAVKAAAAMAAAVRVAAVRAKVVVETEAVG